MRSKDKPIYQVSIIRSGSTLVYQILCKLFPEKEIIKQHHFPKGIRYPIVSTYRDPRDILVSAWRTFILSKNRKLIKDRMAEEDVLLTLAFLKAPINDFNVGWGDNNILWLKYEDFYKDTNVVFEAIEKYFQIEISDGERRSISDEYTINKNKERAKAFKHFGEYDYLGTEIHGDHIFKGAVGGWKEVIPADLHNIVNERLKNVLELWGYYSSDVLCGGINSMAC